MTFPSKAASKVATPISLEAKKGRMGRAFLPGPNLILGSAHKVQKGKKGTYGGFPPKKGGGKVKESNAGCKSDQKEKNSTAGVFPELFPAFY